MKIRLKRILPCLLAVALLFGFLPLNVYAVTYSGECGDNLTWEMDTNTGVLTIRGTGAMTNWSSQLPPWYGYRAQISGVIIPEGVTNIGSRAFESCTELTDINIPSSVTGVGQQAFYGCTGLTGIAIPSGVTSIGDFAFSYCSGLTSAIFSGNITSIGSWAFAYCSGLTRITIPAGLTHIDMCVFYECTGLKTVEIPKSIGGIDVSAFYNCHALTDVYYGGSESEWNAISLGSNNGDLTNAAIHYNQYIPNGSIVRMTRDGAVFDLLSSRQVFSKNSEEEVSITVVPDWQGHTAGRILISQGAGKYVVSANGVFADIQPAQVFDSDGNIYLVLIDASNKTVESVKLKLQVTSSSESQLEGSLSSGVVDIVEAFGVDIPDSVPILGGSKFGLDIGSFSSEVEVDGNEFKVVLGADVSEWKTDENGKWEKQDFEGLKAGFKEAKEKAILNMTNYGEIVNILKKTGGQSFNMILKDETKSKVTVSGYLEGYMDNDGGLKISEGGILIAGEVKYSYQGMVVVVVVPMYYEVGAGGGLKFSGGAKGYVPDEGIKAAFTGSLTPSAFFEAGAGVGIPLGMTAGVKGKVEASLEVALDRVYQKLSIEGSATFQWKGLFNVLLYEKKFAKGTWLIYETGNENTLLGRQGLYSVENSDIYSSIDLDAPVKLEDRSYLNTPSVWVGDEPTVRLMGTDYTNQEIKVLQTNAYPDAAPVMADMGGTKVMAWITDNGERSDVNKSMLVYSAYDASSDTWSAPLALMDNGAPDFYPVMKDGCIVWQKANQVFEDTVNLTEMSQASEIYAAEWNGTGFDTPVRLTDNAALDMQPRLASDGGNVSVVWVTNSADNFLGTEGTNSILCSTLEDGAFGTVETLVSGVNAITGLDAAYIDGGLTLAYAADGDNDLQTIDDREITVYAGGVSAPLTDNEVIDSSPRFVKTSDGTLLFWYGGGNLCYSFLSGETQTVFSDAVSGLTDDFTVITNGNGDMAVLWTEVADGGAEIHGALYDGAAWSEDIQISDVGETVKYPSAILENDGTILAASNRTEKLSDGEGYYTDGQADLCTIAITPSFDLSITGCSYNEADFAPGAEAGAALTLKNIGELAVSGLNVSVSGEKGDIDESYTLYESLRPGEEKEITVTFTMPAEIQKETVTITVTPADGTEYGTDDNEATFAVGRPDPALEAVNLSETLPENRITATVVNGGWSEAANVTAALRLDTEDGEIIDSVSLGNLAPQSMETVTFDVNVYGLDFEDETRQLYVTLSSDSDETTSGNNSEYVLLVNPKAQADFESIIAGESFDSANGILTLNAVGYNNTDADKDAVAIAALYSADGRLVGMDLRHVTLTAYSAVPIDFSVYGNGTGEGSFARYFLLDADAGYKPLDTCEPVVLNA